MNFLNVYSLLNEILHQCNRNSIPEKAAIMQTQHIFPILFSSPNFYAVLHHLFCLGPAKPGVVSYARVGTLSNHWKFMQSDNLLRFQQALQMHSVRCAQT